MGFAKLITKTYLIEIKTADEMMAGTDANVTLCMSGTKGDTGYTEVFPREFSFCIVETQFKRCNCVALPCCKEYKPIKKPFLLWQLKLRC